MTQTAHLTQARVQRATVHSLMGTHVASGNAQPLYTLLLASDAVGMKQLKQIHRTAQIKILTKPADTQKLCSLGQSQANFCAKADGVYSLLQPALGAGDEFLRKSPFFVR